MSEAKSIHFNLDGMVASMNKNSLNGILKLGKEGFRYEKNITNWEFYQVWTKFSGKAKFYFDGREVENLGRILK